jgi:hypothetical protein
MDELKTLTVEQLAERLNNPLKAQLWPDNAKKYAAMLHQAGHSFTAISQLIPGNPARSTVHTWCNDARYSNLVGQSDRMEAFKKSLAKTLLNNADILVESSMEEDKLKKMSTLQGFTAAGIAIQRSQELTNGVSTGVNIQVNVGNVAKAVSALDNIDNKIIDIDAEIEALERTIVTKPM